VGSYGNASKNKIGSSPFNKKEEKPKLMSDKYFTNDQGAKRDGFLIANTTKRVYKITATRRSSHTGSEKSSKGFTNKSIRRVKLMSSCHNNIP
jgi:hypothetical protein